MHSTIAFETLASSTASAFHCCTAVVCVDPARLAASFVGRVIDAEFLADLPRGVDPCGENGEFQTFVFDGPIRGCAVWGRWTRCTTGVTGSRRWSSSPAIRGGRVYAVDARYYFARPVPRVLEGTELMAHLIHPQAFLNPMNATSSPLNRATQKTCPGCSAVFACGPQTGKETCWCNEVPSVTTDAAVADCLCPVCLKEYEAPRRSSGRRKSALLIGEDYYLESGTYVFTAGYHLRRGYCCGNGCRHCPF